MKLTIEKFVLTINPKVLRIIAITGLALAGILKGEQVFQLLMSL